MIISLPNITGSTPQEKLTQLQSYLYQLVGDLQFAFNAIEKTEGSLPSLTESASKSVQASQERQAQDNFNEIKSLIIKSADIVNSYYVEIDKLLKLSGEYVAESDFGKYKEDTETIINASNTLLQSVVTRIETVEGNVNAVRAAQTAIEQTADAVKIAVNVIKENGAQLVKTTSGYVFDKDGLKISKSGEDVENVIDNTGMYVKRSGKAVLEANDKGVKAVDLEASTYLTVGGRSRFENYLTDRTACFWVG